MSSDESLCDVSDETTLPFDPLEINLVHYENPELVTSKTVQTSAKKVLKYLNRQHISNFSAIGKTS